MPKWRLHEAPSRWVPGAGMRSGREAALSCGAVGPAFSFRPDHDRRSKRFYKNNKVLGLIHFPAIPWTKTPPHGLKSSNALDEVPEGWLIGCFYSRI